MQGEMLQDASIQLENVGGIEDASVRFSPGVTILVGRNATNRTSFLQGLMAALGSDDVSVKADAGEAFVELAVGDRTYTRELTLHNGSITMDGEPYLDDSTLADLFAFLLESNEARRAVARNDDLRELIMRPVDTDSIEAEIEGLVEERTRLDDELEEIDSLKAKLSGLEEERTRFEDQIDEKKAELEAKETELESVDADINETREEKGELDERLEELRTKRSELDDVRYDLETERERIEALQKEKNELEAERSDLPEMPAGEIADIETLLERLRERKQSLEQEMSELQNVIGFNEEMLEGENEEVFNALGTDDDEGPLTDQLVSDEVACWTCGSEVNADQIRSTIERLRGLNREKLAEKNELEGEISNLQSKRRGLEQSQRERDRLDHQLSEIEVEIADREESIDRLQERRETLIEEIESVEAEVEALKHDSYSEILDLHREATQLEYELGNLESELERVRDNISSLEKRITQVDDIKAQREELSAEIQDLRTRIERIEQDAVEQFNEHMDALLELLEYDNIDRIWLERVEREVREGRRKVPKSGFELHVIRSTASGAAYEDTVAHLSESEREVTGLVFALAGYLAHEVYETVPFMLLDSLEAIDSERIATLVDYLSEFAGYLLVALLPEDAAALNEDCQRITEI
jgi:chromosome segregation ATPase